MIYNWYRLFNLPAFLATGLPSRELTLNLQDVGQSTVLIFRGNETSIQYKDIFLPIEFADKNPYAISPYAVFRDEDDWIWLGIEVPE